MEEVRNGSEGIFDPTNCGQSDNETLAFIADIKFWFEGVFYMSFGIAGLLSALATVAILATRELRSHLFYQLLIVLATLDILYILCSVPTFSFDIFNWFDNDKTFHHVISRLPDGDRHILRLYVFGPSGLEGLYGSATLSCKI